MIKNNFNSALFELFLPKTQKLKWIEAKDARKGKSSKRKDIKLTRPIKNDAGGVHDKFSIVLDPIDRRIDQIEFTWDYE